MIAHLTDLTEEERAFLQKRVALFGKVLLVINSLGLVVEVTTSITDLGAILDPSMAWLVGATLATGAIWLLCRRGKRSVLFVRTVEVAGVLVYSLCTLVMARYLLLLIVPEYTRGPDLTAPPSQLLKLASVAAQLHMGALISLVFTQVLVLRAALVPTPPAYSAALTTLVGVVLIGITAFGIPGLSLEALIARHTPEAFPSFSSAHFAVWWGFTVIVCAVIAKVVFGLRQQVHEARQLGQYTLEEKLGEGGMGMVYQARHALMRRPTAVKLLPPDKAGEAALARFEREVQLSARLTHPNTITIYDYGRTPDGLFYYAMELLDGATLERVVKEDGPQPAGRVLKILTEVVGALEEAHAVELIHRDIKPANIILCEQGGKPDVAKLLDFGLVKEVPQEGQSQDLQLTREGTLTGTPAYMAPEALTAPDRVDGRSDLYAVGAVGYYLLTGTDVFSGASLVEICGHQLHSEPVPPSDRLGQDVDADLAEALLGCLRKDPAERPQSATELLAQLLACQSMGSWTDRDARRWWEEHGESVRPQRKGTRAPHGGQTLEIDYVRRRRSRDAA